MIVEATKFGPFPHRIDADFVRADLEVYQVEHLRPSYEALVFFNDPAVVAEDESTVDATRPSFAGTFAVFGHSQCWGGHGHCSSPTSGRRFDQRPSHPMTKAFRRVIVTRALKIAVAADPEMTITVVVRTQAPWAPKDGKRLFSCGGLQLATFA